MSANSSSTSFTVRIGRNRVTMIVSPEISHLRLRRARQRFAS
jgi:hypothetical protein